jgi:hypothetical protein
MDEIVVRLNNRKSNVARGDGKAESGDQAVCRNIRGPKEPCLASDNGIP